MVRRHAMLIVATFALLGSSMVPVSTQALDSASADPPQALEPLTVDDDAFHPSFPKPHMETWYYDAVFTQGYSMAVVVTVFPLGSSRLILTGMYLYRDTLLVTSARSLHWCPRSAVSEQVPAIAVDGVMQLSGELSEEELWTYHLTFQNASDGLDVTFVSTMPGWRMDIPGGWWVAVPYFTVTGTLTLGGSTINVTGVGYHDHNWFRFFTPLVQKGWQYVNAMGEQGGVIWIRMRHSRQEEENIVILSQRGRTPVLVDPADTHYQVISWIESDHRKIPKVFTVQAVDDVFHLEITFETLTMHQVEFPMTHYWRYHLKVSGSVSLQEGTETLECVRISDIVRFF